MMIDLFSFSVGYMFLYLELLYDVFEVLFLMNIKGTLPTRQNNWYFPEVKINDVQEK